MEDTRIKFETAKLAKKKGFLKEWADLAYRKDDKRLYGDTGSYTDYPAPTQSILAKWLREEHNIDVLVTSINGSKLKRYVSKIYVNKLYVKLVGHSDNYENTFEKGLQETLKLI